MFAHAELFLQEIAEATSVGLETAKSRSPYARVTLRQAPANEELLMSDGFTLVKLTL